MTYQCWSNCESHSSSYKFTEIPFLTRNDLKHEVVLFSLSDFASFVDLSSSTSLYIIIQRYPLSKLAGDCLGIRANVGVYLIGPGNMICTQDNDKIIRLIMLLGLQKHLQLQQLCVDTYIPSNSRKTFTNNPNR